MPYEQTKGAEAVSLYNSTGRTAQEWQEIQLYDIMAVNDEGLWTHMKYGYSVPRRNGKSEILIMRALWGLLNGERVLYTAHRTTTSHNAWEKVIERLAKANYTEKDDFKTTKQFGLERIEWLKGDGIINFRTRSSKGGLGEGYDLLIIDEAQEYTADQESALKYVVTDSQNPQTLMCGTPPTAVSSGTVFYQYRRDTLSGTNVDSGWAEWSGRHDPCTKVKHNYSHFAGVLRPKDQSKINPKILGKKGYKQGSNTDGSYALKQLLLIDGAKLDDNAKIGKGSVSAINARLKAWGYEPNGIAGKGFVKKLRQKIQNK